MDITLYNITCRDNTLDKTAYLGIGTHTEIFFKGFPFDTLFPIVRIKRTIFERFNYAYLDDNESYYFIAKYIYIDMNFVELHLAKDVLMSNKDMIKESYGIFKRSTLYGSDKMIDDIVAFDSVETISHMDLMTYAQSKFNIHDMGHVFLLVYFDDGLGAGGISNLYTNTTDTYNDGIEPQIPYIMHDLGYQQTGTNYRVLTYTQVFMLAKAILNDNNLLSNIKGLYKIPMNTSTTDELKFRLIATGQREIRLGATTIDLRLNSSDTTLLYAPYSMRSRWVFESFNILTTSDDDVFYKHNPFTRYEIWCPFVGWVEIPSAHLIGKNIKIFYTLNLENGESTCNIYDADAETIIITKSASMLLQIPLSTLNMRDLQDRKTALTLNTLIGTISSAIAIVGGVATSNPVAIGGGVLSLGKTASNAVTGAMSLHPNANVSLLNANSSWMASLYFTLRITTKQAHKIDKIILGLPCNEWRQIKDESYYLECVNVEFDDYTYLCKEEIDMIRNQLARGIYCQ